MIFLAKPFDDPRNIHVHNNKLNIWWQVAQSLFQFSTSQSGYVCN